jgi:hypothetical protein
MMSATAAVLLGLLALGSFWWFPTLAVLLGLLAVITGILGRRRSATIVGRDTSPIWAHRLNFLGIALGTAAVVGSIAVVVTTTG